MLYAIISKNPFIYLYNEKEELLKSDYDFIVENPEECGITDSFEPVEYSALSPSEFSLILDKEVKSGYVYTFYEGNLVKRRYSQAPFFYLSRESGIDYPTYCVNANSIKAGLLTNQELLPVVSALMETYQTEQNPTVSLDIPLDIPDDSGSVLAYICVPVVMRSIPIGMETEEEHQEELEDNEEF